MPRVRLAKVVRELPRRAHDLPRRTVRESQRWRILEAMTEVTAKVGYGEASVADVIARAGVSRKTFYEQFDDKEDCFLTAYDVLSERLLAALVSAGREHENVKERLHAQFTIFLAGLSRDPAAARVFMVDVLGAGKVALRKRELVNRRFAEAVFGRANPKASTVRLAAVVGGVNTVVAAALLENRADTLLDLCAPLSDFVQCALGLAKN